MCNIEASGRTVTPSTGDAALGVSYNFQWNTSSDGTLKYSNCSYTGASVFTTVTGADNCGTQCASSSLCDSFSWWGGWCNFKLKSTGNQVISLADGINSARCGSVVNRPQFNWTIGSNGMALYAKYCGFANLNMQTLHWQFSDEADCGAVCALNLTCLYFAYAGGYCNMYSIANTSIPFVPSSYVSTYYSSCGYVINRNFPLPKWQNASNYQVLAASNCSYIGTDPADIGIQYDNLKWLSQTDCASYCAATSTCNQFNWKDNWCTLMSLVKPVVYFSSTASCGYVVNRTLNLNWTSTSNGQMMAATNCSYLPTGIKQQNDSWLNQVDCPSLCAATSTCTQYKWDSGWCSLMSIVNPVMFFSSSASCGYVSNRKAITWKTSGVYQTSSNCAFNMAADLGYYRGCP